MTGHLYTIPPELLSIIDGHLGQDDRKNLSLASSTTRSSMAPFLFKSLKVKCPLTEDHILHEIIQKFGSHVLNLHLHVEFYPNKTEAKEDVEMGDNDEAEGSAEGDENDQDEEEEDGEEGSDDEAESAQESENGDNEEPDDQDDNADQDDAEDEENAEQEYNDEQDQNEEEEDPWYWKNPPESVWARKLADAEAVKDLLQFKGLPCCSTLSLHTMGVDRFEVEADWDGNDLCDSGMYFCSYEEDSDEVKTKEETYTWRAALRDMWHDVASLCKTQHLELVDFLPRKSSSWQTPEWSDFLGRLKGLDLYPYGGENGAGWYVNTLDGFNEFFKELCPLMLEHAEQLERLKIVGHEDGFLSYDTLKLSPGMWPELKVLHLENMAAPAILPPYLDGKPKNLRELHLRNCVAVETNDYDFELKTWGSLWKAVREVGETPIRVTYQHHRSPPLTEDENYTADPDWKPAEDEEEAISRLRKMVADDKDLIIWPYVEVDEKYGMISDNDVLNVEHLEMAIDNEEYKALRDEMERRRGASTK